MEWICRLRIRFRTRKILIKCAIINKIHRLKWWFFDRYLEVTPLMPDLNYMIIVKDDVPLYIMKRYTNRMREMLHGTRNKVIIVQSSMVVKTLIAEQDKKKCRKKPKKKPKK